MFGKLFDRFKAKPVVPPPTVAKESKTSSKVAAPKITAPVAVPAPPLEPAPAPPVPLPATGAAAAGDMTVANHTRIYKPPPAQAPAPVAGEALFSAVNPSVHEPTPEELCGVTPEMTPAQIKELLANLYRRHNRLTSSLNPELRAEAEMMLDAVVDVRHKHFGEDAV